MAQVQTVQYIDDLDGGEAEVQVEIGYGGKVWRLDLSEANAAELEAALAPYVQAGTLVDKRAWTPAVKDGRLTPEKSMPMPMPKGKGEAGSNVTSLGSGYNKETRAVIREWATRLGLMTSTRGRIPEHVIKQWEAEHGPGDGNASA